jgi:glutamate dehydrogenase
MSAMPQTAYVESLLAALDQGRANAGPAANDELFRPFLRAVGRQVRAPYQARHTPARVVEAVAACFGAVRNHRGPSPSVKGSSERGLTTIITVMPDQPFIVDTVRLIARRKGGTYAGGFHAIVGVERSSSGELVAIGSDTSQAESVVHFEIDDVADSATDSLVADLTSSLQVGQAMVGDFQAITGLVDDAANRIRAVAAKGGPRSEEHLEAAEFLTWLLADNFVFMGAVADGQRVGTTKNTVKWAGGDLRTDNWRQMAPGSEVQVRKGSVDSPVHRAGRVDELLVVVPAADGGPGVALALQGLFTYRAVSQPSRHIPVLRRTLASILGNQDSRPGSYRYKGIGNAFDSLPTEFLFTASEAEVSAMIERVLEAEQEHSAGVHIVQPEPGDVAFVLVAMPKAWWSDALRQTLQTEVVAATGAAFCDHGVFVGRFDTMLVHFYLTGTGPLSAATTEQLRKIIVQRSTPWADRFYTALTQRHDEAAADQLFMTYSGGFTDGFMRNNTPERVAIDLDLIETLSPERSVVVDLYLDPRARLTLRVLQYNDSILSDILPVLDNFGLKVLDQYADPIVARGGRTLHVDSFRLQGVAEVSTEALIANKTMLADAIEAVFSNKIVDDVLNRVVLRAGIPWDAVDLLRAYNGHARQLGLRFPIARVQEILLAQPGQVRALWAYFQARFDPSQGDNRAGRITRAHEALDDGLRQITDSDQDRLFRTWANLMESTLRTNFYRRDRAFHYISFKVDCARVTNMPPPRMMVEVYVHHREVEGIHLRGGPIARGGIRWSDREDFRREVLDLVSTQMVKNVLIVPEGAKGGFYMKQTVADPAERRRKADELYQVLIRGMLDVTDNIVDGKVVHPPDVVFHDGDDPYLVVAADKGTAHLSDTANRLSMAYGFWLDDAFASGGSNGYDHKVVGITARGGWKTTRRRFEELGIDPYTQTFTTVGIGDCGGDVFGNGVIETRTMKLVAAFNHAHVFIDPNPDPEVSYVERKRLFDAVKGWDHYDVSKLGPGGGVFSRRARSIPLSPEAQQLFGVLKDELPVEAVIRQILRLDVDLFWSGGIGTYVKATHQTHHDANDPPNDILRVDASELRCKIIGEGGNLGLTQAARVEFALRGGLIGTDAIDNSGGVDMSDHEVNLKILLSSAMRSGTLDRESRNVLLESLTNEVADFVLDNSEVHGRQLSLDEARATRDPLAFSAVMEWAIQRSGVTRADLNLPSDDELRRRIGLGKGLTRPELAVVAAHVKMHIFKDLMAGGTDEIPGFAERVVRYFPARIGRELRPLVDAHMLHKAIGMTTLTTEVVGESGASLLPILLEQTGATPAAIAVAWLRGLELIGGSDILRELGQSDASLSNQYRAWTNATDALTLAVSQWLTPGNAPPTDSEMATIRDVLERIGRVRGTAHETRIGQRATKYTGRNIPSGLANRLALIGELSVAREIAQVHREGERLTHTTVAYLALGEASRLLPALRAIEDRKSSGRWDKLALGTLRGRYLALLRDLYAAVPIGNESRLGIDRVARRLGRGPLQALSTEMDRILGDQPDLATLLVAEERVRGIIARGTFADDSSPEEEPESP